jgi:hypothetical protein
VRSSRGCGLSIPGDVKTIAGSVATGARVPAPAPSDFSDQVLAAYPQVSRCPSCRRYVADGVGFRTGSDVVATVLAYHESSHTFDLLAVASQHFTSLA